jgi:hypothetical protein
MLRMKLAWVFLAVAVPLVAVAGPPDEAAPESAGAFLVSPMAGWERNDLDAFDHRGRPETRVDDAVEYALFGAYVTPRVAVNDTLFYTDPNAAEVWGNILTATLVGAPERRLTWSLGVGYTWHRIDVAPVTIRIDEPLVKAGLVLRVPSCGVGLNPYVGYAWEHVRTTYGSDAYDTLLYGIIARWDWRMLHATVQYYYQDNLDLAEGYSVLRGRVTCFVTPRWGLLLRGELNEQVSSTDRSLVAGPVLRF